VDDAGLKSDERFRTLVVERMIWIFSGMSLLPHGEGGFEAILKAARAVAEAA
jgi:hypothetical protein